MFIGRSAFDAICVLQHLNAKTREAFVGAETISDKTCIGVREVGRAIRGLKDTDWLEARKTSTANIYKFNEKNMNQMLDRLAMQKDARTANRNRKRDLSVRTRESERKGCARTQESEHARTRESDIHLRGTP